VERIIRAPAQFTNCEEMNLLAIITENCLDAKKRKEIFFRISGFLKKYLRNHADLVPFD
jgi:hypothetical protein